MNKKILEKLKNVIDPELGVDIVYLGLVYKIIEEKNNIKVVMTLTTLGCPFGAMFEAMIKNELGKKTKVEITFDPPWDPSKVDEETRKALGF
ncbi:MAG: metal-sulfur cluster assembly factor [bacterium]|nr:metal-sulfur cluster assembly factor [bacterium]